MTNLVNFLKSSVETAKSTEQRKNENVYTFRVEKFSNKFQIKLIVENLFEVKVEKVRVSRKKPFSKNRRTTTSLEKKAFVKLEEGYRIDDLGMINKIMKSSLAVREENEDLDGEGSKVFSGDNLEVEKEVKDEASSDEVSLKQR